MPWFLFQRLLVSVAVLLSVLVAILFWWYVQTQPQVLVEARGASLDCVSYAPFRRPGESPFDPSAFVTPERIRTDLQLLAPYTGCIRTYSVDQGLDAVPIIAEELGQQVLLGIWIGRDDARNRDEINRALEVAARYPETVTAIIVGNEVLLRREQSAERLAELIAQVRAESGVPVTYADVWEYWMRHPVLADTVDFITVHILPYWEDWPVAVEEAAQYVLDVWHDVTAAFPGRELLIGETGWPSAGRMRGPAEPGRVAQALFVREWVQLAEREDVRYNLIEAFDQPWKRRLEGAMGGTWGFLDSRGEAKFSWHESMPSREQSYMSITSFALTGAMVFAVCVYLLAPVRRGRGNRLVLVGTAALIGAICGLLLPLQWQYLIAWNRNVLEWATSGAFVLMGLLTALLLPFVLVEKQPARPDTRHSEQSSRLVEYWTGLRLLILFTCALFVLLHLFDSRYRGYAIPLWVLPTLGLLLSRLSGFALPIVAVRERLLGLIILLGLPGVLWWEPPGNTQALMFSMLALVICGSALWPPSSDFRISNNRPSRPPNAPGSTA